MATISGTGLSFPGILGELGGVIGPNYIARWARDDGPVASSQQLSNNLGLEVIMPPVTNVNNKYLIIAEVHTDDTNSNTCGVGLDTWVGATPPGGGTEDTQWIDRQGRHNTYISGGYNTYFIQHHWIIDDPGQTYNSPSAVVGQTRKYRVYGNAHNNNINFMNNNVSNHIGWNGYLCVIELDQSLF